MPFSLKRKINGKLTVKVLEPMNIQTILQKIRGLFAKNEILPDPVVELLIKSLQHTRDEECDCEKFFDGMDEYAELNIRGEDAARLMPLIKQHLEICRECCEEYEALLKILEEKMDPTTV